VAGTEYFDLRKERGEIADLPFNRSCPVGTVGMINLKIGVRHTKHHRSSPLSKVGAVLIG